MNAQGTLEPGDIFKTVTGDIWYVDTVSPSGAYCIHLSAHPTPITTRGPDKKFPGRKSVTKVVKRHLRNTVFSLGSIVDLVDPAKLDQLQLKRRLHMARKEGAVQETEVAQTEVAPRPEKVRTTQRYSRTDKAIVKELRGQALETMKALDESKGTPKTAAEIAAMCVYAGSRQEKERVAGFYLSQFKKDGYVEVHVEATTVA